MLSQTERSAHLYKTALSWIPAAYDNPPDEGIRAGLERISDRVAEGKSYKLLDNAVRAIRLQEMRFHEAVDAVSLLFTYADVNMTDPAFAQLRTGDLRFEPKLEGEGISTSAHMVIDLRADAFGQYTAILEEVPGVSTTRITQLLNTEARVTAAWQTHDADKDLYQKYEFEGLAAERLPETMRSSVLNGVELLTRTAGEPEPDALPNFKLKKRWLELAVIGVEPGQDVTEVLNKVKAWGSREGYNEMRMKFRRISSRRQQTVRVSTELEDVAKATVIQRREFSGFSPTLQQATDTMRLDLVERLLGVLAEQRQADSTREELEDSAQLN